MAGVKKVLRCLIKHGGGNLSIFLCASTLRTCRTKRKLVECRLSYVSICNYWIAVVGYDPYAFTTKLSHSFLKDSGVRSQVLAPGLRRPWKPIESPYNPYNSPDIPCQLKRTTPLHPRAKRVVPVSFSVTLQPNETSPSSGWTWLHLHHAQLRSPIKARPDSVVRSVSTKSQTQAAGT